MVNFERNKDDVLCCFVDGKLRGAAWKCAVGKGGQTKILAVVYDESDYMRDGTVEFFDSTNKAKEFLKEHIC